MRKRTRTERFTNWLGGEVATLLFFLALIVTAIVTRKKKEEVSHE